MSIAKLKKAIEEKKVEINELQNATGVFSDLKEKELLLINEVNELEVELLKLNKIEKHKFIVRTYVNRTGKNYMERRFKNFISAEKFFSEQSTLCYYKGYDIRGVVFSELDFNNSEHGSIKKISYPFERPGSSWEKRFAFFLMISNILEVIEEKGFVSSRYTAFSKTGFNQEEKERAIKAFEDFKESLIKSYLPYTEISNENGNIYFNYESSIDTHLFLKNVENNNIKLPNATFNYHSKTKRGSLTIDVL